MSIEIPTLLTSYEVFLFAQNHLSYPEFKIIFGNLAEHLWKKWEHSEKNILYFMTRLDSNNQEKLLTWALEKRLHL